LTAIRVWAILALLGVAVYHALRGLASHCVGAGCDAYVPLSLLLPLVALCLSGVTGLVAISYSRASWRRLLTASTVLSVLGPVAALLLLRDSPDALVPLATVLWLLTPIAALVYSVLDRSG
jgi:hypothetical protein